MRLVVATGEVPAAAEESVRELSAATDDAPWRAVVEPDMRFHRSIIDAAGSERLARAYSSVQSEILLCLVQLRPHYERPAEVAAEHEELIEAIRGGDPERAEELFRKHLAEAADNLTRAWQELTGREGGRMSPLVERRQRRREVLDCRGLPTVQVDLELEDGTVATADVPSGRSTGSNEAAELRDGGRRFGGFGVLRRGRRRQRRDRRRARRSPARRPARARRGADRARRHRAQVAARRERDPRRITGRREGRARRRPAPPLYRALNANAHVLPVPLVNLINGGKHASNDLDFQEFIVIPVGADSILEALQISTEVNLALAEILLDRYGKSALNTGDEGGFAPAISSPQEALGLLHEAVAGAGPRGPLPLRPRLRRDPLYDAETDSYEVAGGRRDREAMIELYLELIRDFDVVTIEDPLDEERLRRLRRADRGERDPDRRRRPLRHRPGPAADRARARSGQLAALEGEPDRHPFGGARCRRSRPPRRLHGRRLGALRRDRGPDHRRPRGCPRRRPDQDRRPGARRAHREVQPPDQDRGGARRRRRPTPATCSRRRSRRDRQLGGAGRRRHARAPRAGAARRPSRARRLRRRPRHRGVGLARRRRRSRSTAARTRSTPALGCSCSARARRRSRSPRRSSGGWASSSTPARSSSAAARTRSSSTGSRCWSRIIHCPANARPPLLGGWSSSPTRLRPATWCWPRSPAAARR